MPDVADFHALNDNIDKFETRIHNYAIKPAGETNPDQIKNTFLPIMDVRNTIEKVRTSINVNKFEESTKSKYRKSAPDILEHILCETEDMEDSQTDVIQAYLVKADKMVQKFDALKQIDCPYHTKTISYLYMNRKDLDYLVSLTSTKEIKRVIDMNISHKQPKGIGRAIIIELMYTILRNCKLLNYSLEQIGSVLSVYYLTHKYFLSSISITTDNVHDFFKEHILLHSVNCLPDSEKIFNEGQVVEVMVFFCQVYLQYLPLIRSLALPNYAFKLNYTLEPDPVLSKKKGKKK